MAIRRLVSTIVVVALSAGLAGCGAHGDRVAGLVPASWTMTARSGHLASMCSGSWEECGALRRTYATHTATRPALGALSRSLRSSGWTVERVDHGRLSAFNARALTSETARLDVEVTDGTASVTYEHE